MDTQPRPPVALRVTRGYLIAVSATLLWSFTGILIRYLSQTYQLPPLVLAFWRDLIVSLALLVILLLVRPALTRPGAGNMGFFILYGLELGLFNWTWTVSVKMNGASAATVMAYSSAGFTAFLGWWLQKEQLSRGKILAVSLSMLGCVLVAGAYTRAAWSLNALGIFTGLLSGLLFAIYSLLGRASALRGINPWTAMLHSFAWAAGSLLVFNLVSAWLNSLSPVAELLWLGDAWMGWGMLALLAVVPSVGGFGLYTVSLGYLPASAANLIATLEPALTAILAYFLLTEQLSPPQLFGGALIVLSVLLLRFLERTPS